MTLKQLKNHFRVLKLCYAKAPGSLLGLGISSVSAVVFTILYNIYSGTVIDSALDVANTQGNIFALFIPLSIFMILLFLTSAAENIKAFYEVIYTNASDLITDEYKTEKNLSLDTQTYIDPKFTAKKNIIEWNGWKVSGSSKTIIELAVSILPTIIYFVVLLSYNWLIGLLTILSSIPLIITSTKFGKRVWSIWDDNSAQKIVWNIYRDSFWGDITDLKLLGAGKYLLNKMIDLQRRFINKINQNEKSRLYSTLWSSGIEYLFLISAYVVLFQGIINKSFTIGAFFVITSALWGVKQDMDNCIEKVSELESNASFVDDFITYINWEPIIKSKSDAVKISKTDPVSIEFRDVWFKYPRANKWIFRGLNFKITREEDVALVGVNGAGKSTLVKLITRMYDPTKGEILINGIPLKNIDLDDYHKAVGLLKQDFRVYEFTAKENIIIGDINQARNSGRIKKYTKLAKAHKFITELKKGYETYLSSDVDEGQVLSGGQKQRLAIARIFYREPKLLILDEPTSAIDAIAEEKIFDNIFEFSENRTVIIISHRFSTVRKANRIMVIDEGKIVEDGTHAQLMKKKGLYKKMHDSQST